MYVISWGQVEAQRRGWQVVFWKTETTFHYIWRVKSSLKLVWMESIPPHATHWLATCWSGAAAHWSDPYLFWRKKFFFDPLGRDQSSFGLSYLCWLGRNGEGDGGISWGKLLFFTHLPCWSLELSGGWKGGGGGQYTQTSHNCICKKGF